MQQISTKGIKEQVWLGVKGDLQGTVQKTEIWLYW